MSLRITALLVFIALVVTTVAIINPWKSTPEIIEEAPWFYQVAWEDLERVSIEQEKAKITFFKTEDEVWWFEEPAGIMVSEARWGGIPFLLAGPRATRELVTELDTVENLDEYGLNNHTLIVDLGLKGGRNLQFVLGDATTDGQHYYAQVTGFPQLVLLPALWGNVVAKLIVEPPVPKWAISKQPNEINGIHLYKDTSFDVYATSPDVIYFPSPLYDPLVNPFAWSIRDSQIGPEPLDIDQDKWEPFYQNLGITPVIGIAKAREARKNYDEWGVVFDSPSVWIVFSETTQTGKQFPGGLKFTIGSKLSDGSGYYARYDTNPQLAVQHIMVLDPDWTESILNLMNDPIIKK